MSALPSLPRTFLPSGVCPKHGFSYNSVHWRSLYFCVAAEFIARAAKRLSVQMVYWSLEIPFELDWIYIMGCQSGGRNLIINGRQLIFMSKKKMSWAKDHVYCSMTVWVRPAPSHSPSRRLIAKAKVRRPRSWNLSLCVVMGKHFCTPWSINIG